MKKRILHISKYYYPILGGQQEYINELIKGLDSSGLYENVVIQPLGAKIDNQFKSKVISPKPILGLYRLLRFFNIHNFDWFVFNIELFFYFLFTKEKFDIIVTNYSFHLSSIITKSPIVVISHGVLWGRHKESIRYFFDKYLEKQDKKIKNKNVIVVANDRDYLITNNIINEKVDYFSVIQDRFWYIPNCIDIEFYKNDHLFCKENIILIPRNLRYDRGVHLAIEAFILFSKTNSNYELVICGGPISGEYYEYCKKIADESEFSNKIYFKGFVSKDELLLFYKKSKITIVPSLDKEGTSLSALESMSVGTPVIATRVGGLVDLPCIISDPNAIDLSLKMLYLEDNWLQVKNEQMFITQQIFNKKNWIDSWLKVFKNI